MKDVLGHHGQERRRTAEQHGHEVERDSGEQSWCGDDEAQSSGRVAERRGWRIDDLVVRADPPGDRQDEDAGGGLQHHGGGVRRHVAKSLKGATEERADDQSALPGRGRQCHRAR